MTHPDKTLDERRQRCRWCSCHKTKYTGKSVLYTGPCCEWCRVKLVLIRGSKT